MTAATALHTLEWSQLGYINNESGYKYDLRSVFQHSLLLLSIFVASISAAVGYRITELTSDHAVPHLLLVVDLRYLTTVLSSGPPLQSCATVFDSLCLYGLGGYRRLYTCMLC